jgi:hypothetical protein
MDEFSSGWRCAEQHSSAVLRVPDLTALLAEFATCFALAAMGLAGVPSLRLGDGCVKQRHIGPRRPLHSDSGSLRVTEGVMKSESGLKTGRQGE